MTRWSPPVLLVAAVASLALIGMNGCSPQKTDMSDQGKRVPVDTSSTVRDASRKGEADRSKSGEGDLEHEHLPGAHGGIMVSLGRDSYHVEAVVESEGKIRLYTLGKDESRVIDVESQTLAGFIKAEGDVDSKSISFEPTPQEGDQAGRTSLFVGQLPKEMIGRKLDVTIPNIRIDGERFRLGFTSGEDSHADMAGMPTKVANDEEQKLYLTSGGHYTAEDIAANGNVTASQKFKGIKSEHDMKPKTGDMLCPISGTKANSKFTWIIGGKPYQFCCPPCVDEFLATAKSSSDPLPDPESFTKK